ncbi:MAG: FKBP-type peptidyl-prolyl cis-trans isomerase [Ghiorsea sp.]|nr:FKBP-type peptidyl-prolyl cis-trans isomerase [Ghiorsea sp.]MDQ7057287.1 FKBP-type peptidyl-prolyl cis-trans isomerase [Ghiorsea sp.]
MNIKLVMVAVVALGLTACNQASHETTEVTLDTESKKFSYAIGMDTGKQLKSLDAGIDAEAFALAISDVFDGIEPKLAEDVAAKIKQEFFQRKQQEKMDERKNAAVNNKAEGEAFLVENEKKDGVKVTASGLQYEVITMGDGAKPKPENTVKVHYKGTTIDGEEFDSSYSRGQPISFPLNGVIKGWTEGVALMPVGSKFRFFIPSELAYGERGAGAKIGPNSTLIFEVELLAIEK